MTWWLLACGPALPEVGEPPGQRAHGSDDSTGPEEGPDAGGEEGEAEDGPVEWTVMVFLNGDNDLERWAILDMYEMEAAGNSDRVHVLVQFDRSAEYDTSAGDWVGTRRYRVEADVDPFAIDSPVLEDLGDVDSGEPEAVVDFVEWSVANYPARRYALVLWDHGDGWTLTHEPAATKGVSYDYTSGNSLSVARGELAEALDGAADALDRPIDLFGIDACLMQTWEVAWVMQPYVRVYVASQDYEDVTGWQYQATLADLYADPEMDAATLGDAIALRFHESVDSTQSVLDLERLPALSEALDSFAAAALDAGHAADVLDAAGPAQGFDGEWSRDNDLVDLIDNLGVRDVPTSRAASTVREKALEVVIANYTLGEGVNRANGLSIFSPPDGAVPDLYREAAWAAETLWDDLVVEGARDAAR
ncbi:MAG: clostripain-related cysteine peptidase [Myxococcota bacterium]